MVHSVRSCQGRKTLKAYPLSLDPLEKNYLEKLSGLSVKGEGGTPISAKVFLTVREWTNAERAFLLENKIQGADFAQIHALR